jgi:tetratricopeptide (TPR) repeat protein
LSGLVNNNQPAHIINPSSSKTMMSNVFHFLLALGFLISTACPLEAQEPAEVTLVEADKLYRAGDCEAAIRAYESIVTRHPQDGTSAIQLAHCYEKLQQLDHAATAYQLASQDPLSAGDAFHALARLRAGAGDIPAAIALLNKALDSGFDDSRSLLKEKEFTPLLQHPRAFLTLRKLFGSGFSGFTAQPSIVEKRRGLQLLHDATEDKCLIHTEISPLRSGMPH